MPKSMIFEGKTTNEAIEKGLKEFHVSKEKVDIKVLEEEKRSFFSILEPRKVKIEMTLKEENVENRKYIEKEKKIEQITEEEIEKAKKEVERFLKEFIDKLPTKEIEYKVENNNPYLNIDIQGKDINYLIGYRGENLNSLQIILSSFISNVSKSRIKVILDIGNYKEKRKKTLEELAERTASRVIKTKKQVALEPMQPYERKIIHSKLQENNKVKTFSVGEEPHRKIVIAPM